MSANEAELSEAVVSVMLEITKEEAEVMETSPEIPKSDVDKLLELGEMELLSPSETVPPRRRTRGRPCKEETLLKRRREQKVNEMLHNYDSVVKDYEELQQNYEELQQKIQKVDDPPSPTTLLKNFEYSFLNESVLNKKQANDLLTVAIEENCIKKEETVTSTENCSSSIEKNFSSVEKNTIEKNFSEKNFSSIVKNPIEKNFSEKNFGSIEKNPIENFINAETILSGSIIIDAKDIPEGNIIVMDASHMLTAPDMEHYSLGADNSASLGAVNSISLLTNNSVSQDADVTLGAVNSVSDNSISQDADVSLVSDNSISQDADVSVVADNSISLASQSADISISLASQSADNSISLASQSADISVSLDRNNSVSLDTDNSVSPVSDNAISQVAENSIAQFTNPDQWTSADNYNNNVEQGVGNTANYGVPHHFLNYSNNAVSPNYFNSSTTHYTFAQNLGQNINYQISPQNLGQNINYQISAQNIGQNINYQIPAQNFAQNINYQIAPQYSVSQFTGLANDYYPSLECPYYPQVSTNTVDSEPYVRAENELSCIVATNRVMTYWKKSDPTKISERLGLREGIDDLVQTGYYPNQLTAFIRVKTENLQKELKYYRSLEYGNLPVRAFEFQNQVPHNLPRVIFWR